MLVLQTRQGSRTLRCLLVGSLSTVGTKLGRGVVVLLFSARRMVSSVFLLHSLHQLLVLRGRGGKNVGMLDLSVLQSLLDL